MFTFCDPKLNLGRMQLIEVKLEDSTLQISSPIVTFTLDMSAENLLPFIVNVVLRLLKLFDEIELISGVESIVNVKLQLIVQFAFTPFTYTINS